jgi:hypothetical protein
MSGSLTLHIIKLWYRRLQWPQVVASLFCVLLIGLTFFPWLHIYPPDTIRQWTKYLPLDMDSYYSGYDILGFYVWIPILFAVAILTHIYKKVLIILMIPTALLMYQKGLAFAKEIESTLPFAKYLKEYLAAHEFYVVVYLYAFFYVVLFIYSIYILFRK